MYEQSIADKSTAQIFKETVTKNYININGRASRREFWLFQFCIAPFMIAHVYTILKPEETSFFILIPVLLFMLFITIPSICISVRRLHDVGYSGLLYLLVFIPFGSLVLLGLTILPSKEGSNKYGPNPYDEDDNNYQPIKENLEVNLAFKTPDIPNKIDPNKPSYKV